MNHATNSFRLLNELDHVRIDRLLSRKGQAGETLTELRQAFAIAEAELEGGISPRVAPL